MTRERLEGLFARKFPVSMCWDFDEGEQHSAKERVFNALLDIGTDEAFLAAAMMCVCRRGGITSFAVGM
jgi:hypothetical protein